MLKTVGFPLQHVGTAASQSRPDYGHYRHQVGGAITSTSQQLTVPKDDAMGMPQKQARKQQMTFGVNSIHQSRLIHNEQKLLRQRAVH